jgi:hypothetical protein
VEALGNDAVARAGGVRYLANGTNPLTPQRIGITIAGAGTSGTGSVVVKGTPIRLEVTAERTTVRPLKTGAPNAAALVVRALRGTEPVAGMPVELRVEPVPNSGGHDHHDASRPRGTVSSTSGVTGADGKFTTEYTASEIAGVEEVIARSPQAGEEVKARIEVKVEGLVAFPQTGNYALTGMKPAHRDNHYFSQAAVDDLVKAANEFVKEEWNTSGKMRLNDMSLEWGGLFDINGDWRTPHSLHRVGRSVDIENLVMVTIDTVDQKTGKETKLTVPKVEWVRDFVRFMETEMGNWRFIDEGQTHPDIFKRTRKYPHFEWKGR